MAASRTKISVIMACYNAAEYLDDAISSILNQTFPDFEFIIVDDGSADNTLDIIKKYADKDNRVIFYSQVNLGPSAARNVAIDMAKGEWIANLDSDDIALPKRLELQLSYIEAKPKTVLLGSGCIEIDASGDSVKKHWYPARHNELVRRLERTQAFFPHSSCLYKKDAIDQVGGFNKFFIPSEDWDLWLRLSEVGQIACLPQALVKLRKHSRGISHHNRGKTQLIMGMAATMSYFLRLKNAADPWILCEDNWRQFIDWLTVRLEEEGVFKTRQYWSELRQTWFNAEEESALARGLKVASGLTNSKHGFWIVWNKLFGSNLAAKLADEWIRLESVGRLKICNSKKDN